MTHNLPSNKCGYILYLKILKRNKTIIMNRLIFNTSEGLKRCGEYLDVFR